MPGSKTTPGLAGPRNDAPVSFAFRGVNKSAPEFTTLSRLDGWPIGPLPTLRSHPRGGLRTDRGRRGLLLLHRSRLSPHTPGALTYVAACTLAPSPYFVTAIRGAPDISSPPCLPRVLPAGAIAG